MFELPSVRTTANLWAFCLCAEAAGFRKRSLLAILRASWVLVQPPFCATFDNFVFAWSGETKLNKRLAWLENFMAANFEPGFASPIRSLIALKPLLNWSKGMEPESSMMKTTSYSEPRSTDPDITLWDVAEVLLSPLGLERLGSREKGLLEDGRLRRRKGRFLASLLAVSIFDGLPKIRSINEVNNYLQIPCERWLITRLPSFQRYSKNQTSLNSSLSELSELCLTNVLSLKQLKLGLEARLLLLGYLACLIHLVRARAG